MICACGKAKMDGIKCKLGATHLSYEASVRRFREMNPHVPYPPDVKPAKHPAPAIAALPVSYATKPVAHRERLPIKRERLEPKQGRLF